MSITIVAGPHDRECYFCKALKTYSKPMNLIVHNNTEDDDEMAYAVEAMIKFCPKCGNRLICENDYNESWVKQYKDYFQSPFYIESTYVTDDLIKALNKAKKDYFDKVDKEIKIQKHYEAIWSSMDHKEE